MEDGKWTCWRWTVKKKKKCTFSSIMGSQPVMLQTEILRSVNVSAALRNMKESTSIWKLPFSGAAIEGAWEGNHNFYIISPIEFSSLNYVLHRKKKR